MELTLFQKSVLKSIPSDWKAGIMGEVFDRVTRRNTDDCRNTLTISAQHGLVDQEEYFNKIVAGKETENYFLIKNGEFAYNKSYSKGYPVGAIKRLDKYDKGILSVLYICFRINSDEIISEFANQYFANGFLDKQIASVAQEGARAHGLLNISPREFFSLAIPLPPLPEQKKVAAILASVDTKVDLIKKKIQATRVLKKGLMQKLFREGSGQQDASGQWQPHTEFKESELGRIPKGWCVSKLESLIEIKHGWAFPGDFFGNKGPILLTPGNFLKEGGLYFEERNTKRYSGEYSDGYIFSTGDLVVVMTDLSSKCEILGNMGLVEYEEMLLHNQRVGKVECDNSKIIKDFVRHYSQSDYYKRMMLNSATGTTVRHTSPSKIRAIDIPVPSLEEQTRVSEILNALDEKISHLISETEKTNELKKGLMQKLLTGQWRVKVDSAA